MTPTLVAAVAVAAGTACLILTFTEASRPRMNRPLITVSYLASLFLLIAGTATLLAGAAA